MFLMSVEKKKLVPNCNHKFEEINKADYEKNINLANLFEKYIKYIEKMKVGDENSILVHVKSQTKESDFFKINEYDIHLPPNLFYLIGYSLNFLMIAMCYYQDV